MNFLNITENDMGKYYSDKENKYCKIKLDLKLLNNLPENENILKKAEKEEFYEIFNIYPEYKKAPDNDKAKQLDKNYFCNNNEHLFGKTMKVNETYFDNLLTQPDIRGFRTPKTIYVANPLIKYLIIGLYSVYKNINNSSDGDISKKTLATLRKASVFFIYKFINFIVKQGRGIVTNLEHLKFFFLSRTGQITSYNKANPTKNFYFNDPNEVLKQPKIYTVDTQIIDKTQTSITLQERVNMGQMETYRLLSVLQDLAQSNPTLSALWDDNKKYLDIMTSTAGKTSALGAIFVMFTNIKVFLDKATDEITDKANTLLQAELNKLCTAEFDTLEFAESISSATRSKPPPKPIVPVAPLEAGKKTIADFIVNPANAVNNLGKGLFNGGAIKQYRKFNLNDLKPKHNIYRRTKKVKSIKRNNNQRSQRTKKNN
jgi:hypothetical protein